MSLDNFTYRQSQNLDKLGPVYSTKDEKQRVISENILNLKIKPTMQVNINRNIPGLDKKKKVGLRNPAYFRLYSPLSHVGKTGIRFMHTQPNIQRFIVPGFVFAFYYYTLSNYTNGTYIKMELHNYEDEFCYPKMSLTHGHFIEKFSLMA
jgi:hypothetical protein